MVFDTFLVVILVLKNWVKFANPHEDLATFFNKKAILHWFLAMKSCKNPNNCRGAAKQWALRAQIRPNGVKKQATKGNSYVGALSMLARFPEEEEGQTRKL